MIRFVDDFIPNLIILHLHPRPDRDVNRGLIAICPKKLREKVPQRIRSPLRLSHDSILQKKLQTIIHTYINILYIDTFCTEHTQYTYPHTTSAHIHPHNILHSHNYIISQTVHTRHIAYNISHTAHIYIAHKYHTRVIHYALHPTHISHTLYHTHCITHTLSHTHTHPCDTSL